MLLLLIRHAQAGERDAERWPDDRERPVTNPGRAAHAKVSRALRRLDVAPTVVLTSPWTRAVQTAEVMVEEMDLDLEPTPCEALTTEPDVQELAKCVPTDDPHAVVALVGHSPFIEDLASILLAGAPGRLNSDFPKSGVMGIDTERIEAGTATLRFFLRPKQLDRLKRRRK
jgi:phosphohistidine phosphatase